MITTVTMNPCIDKTITIDGFHYGSMNRVQSVRLDMCGKGINTAVALHQTGYGADCNCIGINYRDGAERFSEGLKALGIDYRAVLVQGILRENIKLVETTENVMTEINQKGSPVTQGALTALEALLEEYLHETTLLVVSGSTPQGVPPSYYRRLIECANTRKVPCILDAEGSLLAEGVKAKPFLIKPNLFEFETAFGLQCTSDTDVVALCREITAQGVELVCLSMGQEGALMVSKDKAYHCKGVPIEVLGTTGAGDSMVAGIAIACQKGLPMQEMLRYGVAMAHGSLVRAGTQLCQKEDLAHFLSVIEVEKVTEYFCANRRL